MYKLSDFHIHIHIDYFSDYQKMFNYFNEKEIYALFVTNLPEIFEKCKNEFPQSNYVKLGLGYNPQLASTHPFNRVLFDKYLPNTKYIGEVGLDYSREFVASKQTQLGAFEYICKKAGEENKILSIHSRKAETDILQILIKNKVEFAVFHWYSGSIGLIDEIINNGYFFSVNYSMLVSKKGFEIIKRIPLDRVLIETDAPFGKSKINKGELYNLDIIYDEFEKKLQVQNLKSVIFNNLKQLLLKQKTTRI